MCRKLTGEGICDIIEVPDCNPELSRREVSGLEVLLTLLISVEAGLLVELIGKWLDGHGKR